MPKHIVLEKLTAIGAHHDDLKSLGYFLHRYATSLNGSARLEEAGLLGTARRHSVSKTESFRTAYHLAAAVRQGKMGAFAICAADTKRFVGLVTVMPDIELRRAGMRMPGKLMRRVLKPSELTSGRSNVAAWVDPDRVDERHALAETYGQVGRRTLLWTLAEQDSSDRTNALYDADFYPVAEGRFDDQEFGWQVPPVRSVFINSPRGIV